MPSAMGIWRPPSGSWRRIQSTISTTPNGPLTRMSMIWARPDTIWTWSSGSCANTPGEKSDRNNWMRDARDYAVRWGKLLMLEFVYLVYTERMNSAEIAAIALKKWTSRADPSIMDKTSGYGHHEMLKFLHSHHDQKCTTTAMDNAAENGHFSVVQWLHENRSEGCITRAMDDSASNGHLAVDHWLQQNRAEGCTDKAVNSAATNGHLDVVQWLYGKSFESCTKEVIDLAAKNGNLPVVKFLHRQLKEEGFTPDSLAIVASRGDCETFRWLQENGSATLAPGWEGRIVGRENVCRCLALSAKAGDCPVLLLDRLIKSSDFATIDRLLTNARSEITSDKYVAFSAVVKGRLDH